MGRRASILILVTLALLGTLVAPAPAASLAPHLAVVDLAELAAPSAAAVSNGAEPNIHVTRDGGVILIGDYTGLYRSLNGGATWTKAPDPFLGGLFADGWGIAEDDTGRIYVTTTQGQVVGVASSANRGQTWDIVSTIVAVGSIVDRPWVAARGNGEVSLIVNSDTGEECYRSVDSGATFLDRSHVSTGAPNPGSVSYDSKGRLWYSNGATWYKWANPCFSTPTPVDHPNGGAQILTQAALDAQDRPYTAIPSVGNGQMMVHALGPGGVFRSIAVSPAAQKSNTFGAIAIDNATGDVAVGWYGSTTAGNPSGSFSGSWHVFVARVSNYWSANPTITVTQVTTTPNHVGGYCMSGIACSTGGGDRDLLDYFGVTFAPDHSIHVAYGHDGSTSNAEVRYAHVL